MESLRQWLRDLRFAARSLRKSPAFATAAILTLALGIGANTAIFSVLQGVVLAPLLYVHPDRLVIVDLYNRALKYPTELSYPDFLDWQRESRSFDQIAAFSPPSNGVGFDLTSPGAPEHVPGEEVSPNLFTTLGVALERGRSFSPSENHYGGPPAIIISNRLWRNRFAASPAVLGTSVTLNGVDYTIVGILPREFRFGREQADVFTAIGRVDPFQLNDRTNHSTICVARLRPDVSIGQARAEMNALQDNIDRLNPLTERSLGVWIEPLKHFLVGDVGGTLFLLLGAVGLVLLIACANVANLLLARSAARTREFAVRLALGASRIQIVRQLITETVLLSLTGGALGLAVAKWSVSAVLAATPESLPRIENIGVNVSVLFFVFAISMAVGILFGLLPARRNLNVDLQESLKEGSRGSAGGQNRTQRSLVVVQVALALMLLTGAGLLLRTIHNLWRVNPGFDTRHVITFRVGLSPSLTDTALKMRTAYRQLLARIRDIPGVQAADMSALLPLAQGQDNSGPFWLGSHQPASMAEIPRAIYYWTGPDYQTTMKIPLLRGRFLSAADTENSEPVVLIDNLLARRYFPGRDPVGQNITVPHWGMARIVGVVGHVEQYGLAPTGPGSEKPQIYGTFYQLSDRWLPVFSETITLIVRTSVPAATVMPAIRNAVYGAGDNQPVYNIRTMQELVSGAMASQRLPMLLLAAFAALALLLAWVGIYGVISYSMTQRVREVGIRMALGAVKRDVLRMVIAQGLRLALIGIAAGAIAALALVRLLSSFSSLLYGVRATDPPTFIAVSLVLISAALLACYIPARRAAKLDPMAALRHE